jgi:hypothetical protein
MKATASVLQAKAAQQLRITVPAATYILNVHTGSSLPRCPPAKVAVSAGPTVQANISCDTGIR